MLLRALVYRYGCGAPVSGLEHALAEQERRMEEARMRRIAEGG